MTGQEPVGRCTCGAWVHASHPACGACLQVLTELSTGGRPSDGGGRA